MSDSTLQAELKQSRPFEHVETAVMLNLARTFGALRVPGEALLKEHGLSSATYNVLRILRGAGPEGRTCSDIGDRMVTRVPDVTRLLDRLSGADLVTRERDTEDRRVVITRITQEGLDLLEALDGPIERIHRDLLGHMSEDELAALSRLLEKAREGRSGVEAA